MAEKWILKTDEESKLPVFTNPENDEELPKPVYISPEGKEIALDPVGMYGKILEMGKNEKEIRGNVKRLEDQLSLFADIEDVPAWKEEADKALTTVANFNDKEWMDVKKVEKLKEEMKDAHAKQLSQVSESFSIKEGEYKENLSKKDGQIRRLMVSNKFATHELFSGNDPKTSLPPEIAETYFGKNFKVEETDNGDLILRAYYDNGDSVYSHENPGELADFHEAMHSIFDKYPGKEKLMRGGQKGSGAGGGSGDGDEGDGDELEKLRKQHAEAQAAGNVQLMVALKNKIFAEQKKGKAA